MIELVVEGHWALRSDISVSTVRFLHCASHVRDVARNQAWSLPCSVTGHVPTLPWVRSRVWVSVRASFRGGVGRDVARNQAWSLPCSVTGHVPTLPWVRSRVWVRVRASFRGRVVRDVARNQAWSSCFSDGIREVHIQWKWVQCLQASRFLLLSNYLLKSLDITSCSFFASQELCSRTLLMNCILG